MAEMETAAGVTAQAKAEALLMTIEGLVRRGDELHGQRVADLEKAIAGLHDVLRDLAGSAMRLVEINAPRDPTDMAVIEDVIRRARNVMAYLEPPSH